MKKKIFSVSLYSGQTHTQTESMTENKELSGNQYGVAI